MKGYPKIKRIWFNILHVKIEKEKANIPFSRLCGDSLFFGDGIIPEMFSGSWQIFNFSGMIPPHLPQITGKFPHIAEGVATESRL